MTRWLSLERSAGRCGRDISACGSTFAGAFTAVVVLSRPPCARRTARLRARPEMARTKTQRVVQWHQANPMPATDELMMMWVARYQQEVGDKDPSEIPGLDDDGFKGETQPETIKRLQGRDTA